MPKRKYHFDHSSLEFNHLRLTVSDYVKKFLSYLTTSVVFSGFAILLAFNFFPSPQEKVLKRENEQYKLQLQILDDRLERVSAVLSDIQKRDDDIYRVIFAAEPVSKNERFAGYGGADRYESLQGYNNSQLLTETAKKIDMISRQLYVQSKSFDDVFALAKRKTEMLECIPAIQPISNKDLTKLSSGFGYRIHPVYKTMHMHTGIDFTAQVGTPIYSTGNGIITNPIENMSGYGQFVLVDHGFGYKTLYAHLSKINVKRGQKVKRGEIIGFVGNTGLSTGPHLHYEVWIGDKPVDPVHFFINDLTPEEYQKIIEIASRINQSLS